MVRENAFIYYFICDFRHRHSGGGVLKLLLRSLKEKKNMTMMMSRKALEEYGLVNLGNINWNLSPAVLTEHALARQEGKIAANGALAATTGIHTGRSPKE